VEYLGDSVNPNDKYRIFWNNSSSHSIDTSKTYEKRAISIKVVPQQAKRKGSLHFNESRHRVQSTINDNNNEKFQPETE
jgi:ribosomal protein S2